MRRRTFGRPLNHPIAQLRHWRSSQQPVERKPSEPTQRREAVEHVVRPRDVKRSLVLESTRLASVEGRRSRRPDDERIEQDEQNRLEDAVIARQEMSAGDPSADMSGYGDLPQVRLEIRPHPCLAGSADRHVRIRERVQDRKDRAVEILSRLGRLLCVTEEKRSEPPARTTEAANTASRP